MSREMKDSGIAWIGEIPKGWIRAKYRYSGVFTKGKLPNEQNIECLGKPIIGASEMLGKECRNFSLDTNVPTCQKQDVLILWDGANAGIVANNCDGIVSSTVVKYECTDENFDSQFLFYLFKNGEHFFKSKVNGTTIPHMNQKYIDEYLCIQPTLPEQQKIAEFLDRKCGEIDELVALQEKMIEELKAYKQSVITEAVTKGLNPNAPMKNSGIEWIGEIPEHWEVKELKFALEGLCDGTHGTYERVSDGKLLLSAKNIGDNGIIVGDNESQISYEDYVKIVSNGFPRIGDVLLCCVGSIGKCCLFENDEPIAFQRSVAFLRNNKTILSRYLMLLLKSNIMQAQYGMFARKSAQSGIYMGLIKDFIIVSPSLSEQQQIADYLDKKCAEIDELVAVKQQKIETLKEYKKSLIYEYVTGKKEVI